MAIGALQDMGIRAIFSDGFQGRRTQEFRDKDGDGIEDRSDPDGGEFSISSGKSRLQPNREMAPDSFQANFENRMKSGVPLTGEEVLEAKRFASSKGLKFNANIGYRPATAQGREGTAMNWREQKMASKSDFNKVKTSKFVPADVRAIEALGGPQNMKQAKRTAQFQSSTAGQRIAAGDTGRDGGSIARPGNSETRPQADSRGQPMVSGGRGKEYAAKIGSAWGNALDQADDAKRQAKKAGISVEERNRMVAEGKSRMDKFRANLKTPGSDAQKAFGGMGYVPKLGAPDTAVAKKKKQGVGERRA